MTIRPRIAGYWALLLCLVLAASTGVVEARKVRILCLSWLSFGSGLLQNDDIYASSAIIPVAIQHFNDRADTYFAELSKYKSCNVTLELADSVMYDTHGLPNVAMGLFIDKFTVNAFDVVLTMRTEVAQPIGVTAGALNIPVITHVSSSDMLSNKLIYPTFFRNALSDNSRTLLLSRLLKYTFGYRAIGLIYIDDAFGTALRASLQTACALVNIRLVAAGFKSAANGANLDTEVAKALRVLIDERIRIIYHAGVDNNFLFSLAKAAKEANWIDDRMYISNRMISQSALDEAPNRADMLRFLQGTLIISGANDVGSANFQAVAQAWPTFNVTDVNRFFPDNTTDDGAPFTLPEDYFVKRAPQAQSLHSWALAYDLIMSVGIAACGKNSSMKENLRTTNFQGVTGPMSFDASFNRLGELVVLSNIQVSGDNMKTVTVGTVTSSGNWTIDMQNIQFDDGSNVFPIDIEPPVHEIDQLTYGAKVWGAIETVIATGLSLATVIYLVRHREDQAIVESQPIFMFILACGCVLMGSSIAGLIVETDFGCMWFPWMFSSGFTLALASIIAKSVRVAILWYSRGPLKRRNQSVRGTVLLSGVALTLLGLVTIMIAWQVVAPLTFEINTTKRDSYDYPLYSSAMCVTAYSLSTTFLALMITYVCLVVFVTMWVSFWVRNAPEKFQEARMTAIAGVSMFQVFFVGIPTAAAVWNMALPRFLVLSSLTFLLCLIILFTMFLPKILRDRFGVERSSELNQQNQAQDPSGAQTDDRNLTQDQHQKLEQAMLMRGYGKGVVNVRGKKRKRPEKSETNRSVVDRVLESVQEMDDSAAPHETDEGNHTGSSKQSSTKQSSTKQSSTKQSSVGNVSGAPTSNAKSATDDTAPVRHSDVKVESISSSKNGK